MAQVSTLKAPTFIDLVEEDESSTPRYRLLGQQMQSTANEPMLARNLEHMMTPRGIQHDTQVVNSSYLDPDRDRIGNLTSCLKRSIEMYPDISHDYVRELWESSAKTEGDGFEHRLWTVLENIIATPNYPKEKDKLSRPVEVVKKVTLKAGEKGPEEYFHAGVSLLAQEFPEASKNCIRATLNTGSRRVADAFTRLASKRALGTLPPHRGTKRKHKETAATPQESFEPAVPGPWLEYATAELDGARKELAEKEMEAQKAAAELRNEEEARASGTMIECGCCFTDVPLNRTITCASKIRPHAFCFDCSTSLVKNEIADRKCRPMCMAISGCEARFSESQLRLCLTEKMLGHLLRLQQQDDIRAAGIEGLEECPFCNYMAICAPKEVDKEFECHNPDCSKTSCRLCNALTHLPKTCAEAKADNIIDARHTIEEAMTEALVRVCNKKTCGNRFVKLEGCNKMTCNRCGTFQCYVCRQTIEGYDHFGVRPGQCQQFDDDASLSRLHATQVKKAEEAARAKVQAETGIADDALAIKVSDRVRQDEENAQVRQHFDWLDYLPDPHNGQNPWAALFPRPEANIQALHPGYALIAVPRFYADNDFMRPLPEMPHPILYPPPQIEPQDPPRFDEPDPWAILAEREARLQADFHATPFYQPGGMGDRDPLQDLRTLLAIPEPPITQDVALPQAGPATIPPQQPAQVPHAPHAGIRHQRAEAMRHRIELDHQRVQRQIQNRIAQRQFRANRRQAFREETDGTG